MFATCKREFNIFRNFTQRRVDVRRSICRPLQCTTPSLQAETINRLLKKQSKSKAKRSALSTAEASASEGEREVEQEEKEVILPTTWRWVSSTRPLVDPSTTSQEDAAQSKMRLTLGVPISVLSSTTPAPQPPLPKEKPQCDVPGCTEIRKYRLVRDWVRGACGLTHLKVLEVEAGTKMEVA
jgi:Ino eighty subunit 2